MELIRQPDSHEEITVRAAVIDHVRACLDAAPVLPAYHSVLSAALRVPGNLLSDDPDTRWARLVWTCCRAVGGEPTHAVPVAGAVEMFMVALDILDDLEDEEPGPLHSTLSSARILNLSTGLLLIAQHSLLDVSESAAALNLLLSAGLRACSGQDAESGSGRAVSRPGCRPTRDRH